MVLIDGKVENLGMYHSDLYRVMFFYAQITILMLKGYLYFTDKLGCLIHNCYIFSFT